MQLFLRLLTGEAATIEIDPSPDYDLPSIKRSIFSKTRIPIENQRVIIEGKVLPVAILSKSDLEAFIGGSLSGKTMYVTSAITADRETTFSVEDAVKIDWDSLVRHKMLSSDCVLAITTRCTSEFGIANANARDYWDEATVRDKVELLTHGSVKPLFDAYVGRRPHAALEAAHAIFRQAPRRSINRTLPQPSPEAPVVAASGSQVSSTDGASASAPLSGDEKSLKDIVSDFNKTIKARSSRNQQRSRAIVAAEWLHDILNTKVNTFLELTPENRSKSKTVFLSDISRVVNQKYSLLQSELGLGDRLINMLKRFANAIRKLCGASPKNDYGIKQGFWTKTAYDVEAKIKTTINTLVPSEGVLTSPSLTK